MKFALRSALASAAAGWTLAMGQGLEMDNHLSTPGTSAPFGPQNGAVLSKIQQVNHFEIFSIVFGAVFGFVAFRVPTRSLFWLGLLEGILVWATSATAQTVSSDTDNFRANSR